MSTFRGEFEATVDAKGRFLLPAGIKKKLPEGTTTFMLNRGIEKCLTLYSEQSWLITEQQVSQLNDFEEEYSAEKNYDFFKLKRKFVE